MNRKTFAVRSMLGWLLLAACVILAVYAVTASIHPAQVRCFAPLNRLWTVENIPVQAGEVPVNSADEAALDKLPGVGPATAQAIIRERETNGPFFYPGDLMHVKGIGPKKLKDMRIMLDLREAAP